MEVSIHIPDYLPKEKEIDHLTIKEYKEKYQINEICANAIKEFSLHKEPNFKAYAALT